MLNTHFFLGICFNIPRTESVIHENVKQKLSSIQDVTWKESVLQDPSSLYSVKGEWTEEQMPGNGVSGNPLLSELPVKRSLRGWVLVFKYGMCFLKTFVDM